jgi:dipeptide/tripeptide permease
MAFVYFTPFLGGLIADRYLGYRRSVFIGGLLLAAGYFCLGVRGMPTLYAGLVLICLGNGLFKPNISAMVGNLYGPGDPKRDSGFNIFYMGINIGASLSALLSAPLRNEWDFNVAFIAAGIGLLIGVVILSIYWKKLESADRQPERDPRDVSLGKIVGTILLPAALFGGAGFYIGERIPAIDNSLGPITFGFIVGMIPVLFYFLSLVLRATPEEKPGLASLIPVYIAGGAFFMILHLSAGLMTLFTEHNANREGAWMPDPVEKYYCQQSMPSYFRNADPALPRPDEKTLLVVPQRIEAMFGARRISEEAIAELQAQHPDVRPITKDDPEHREQWGFLACDVFPESQMKITTGKDEHGLDTVSVSVPETEKPLRRVLLVRTPGGETFPVVLVTQEMYDKVYKGAADARLPRGGFLTLLNAELITGFLNPFFVVVLTPIVVAFFTWRVRTGKPISTARKIMYGMLITFVSLLFMAGAAYSGGDGAHKVSLWWLVMYYLVITVGELCLSPMGLSLVTKLSPKRLVGLMMGGWFVSTAVGNKLSGFISSLPPTTTMFIVLALAPLAVAIMIMLVLPMLDRAIKKYHA